MQHISESQQGHFHFFTLLKTCNSETITSRVWFAWNNQNLRIYHTEITISPRANVQRWRGREKPLKQHENHSVITLIILPGRAANWNSTQWSAHHCQGPTLPLNSIKLDQIALRNISLIQYARFFSSRSIK